MRSETRQARRRHLRHSLLQLAVLLTIAALLGRAFQLQIVNGELWRTKAIAQHEERVSLPAPRGRILDREGRELVVSRTTYEIYVAPFELSDRSASSQFLRSYLQLKPESARDIAEGKRRWVRLPGAYSVLQKEQLERRIPIGLHTKPLVHRFYPRGELAAEIVGRVDINGRGQSGLELSFDSVLAGQPGFGVRQRDATGASADWLTVPIEAPTAGSDVHLTIDAEMQALAESVLEDAIAETGASGGDLLILDPRTGELLAAVSRRLGARLRTLKAATEPYEAGSTLKPFSAAAIIAEGLASLNDSVNTGNGQLRLAGRTIRDEHSRGVLTLAQTLTISSNVGMAMFAQRLPEGAQYRYLRDFGFGTPTGISYPSESAGLLRRPSQWSRQSRASLAIGYEVAVTPLQLAMAYGALANGGLLMWPQLVRATTTAEGARRWTAEPRVIRRVVPEDVAAQLREVLARAVTQGTGRSAGVRGVSVAGKTGTAWRFDRELGYAGRSYTSSFVGLIPSDDPQLVILVKLDAPSGTYYGGMTAAPVMRTAVRAALAGSYWSAPPLMGEPEIPDEQAGVPADQASAGSPFVFALDTPLLRAAAEEADLGSSGLHAGELPDVRGLSLRAAAQQLHQGGWRVVVQGGGRVVSMRPAAGAVLLRGERVVVSGVERANARRSETVPGSG